MTYLIAAAGTGGHVFPGLAVGEALVDLGVPRAEILFVGADRLESTVYPAEGFPFLGLTIRGLQRSFTMKNLALPSVVLGAKKAVEKAMLERTVRVSLGMGGYVTVPVGLAARRRRIPVFVSEQNAVAGLANKIVSRWASGSFGSFARTVGLPDAIWSGNPLRRVFWEFDRDRLRHDGLARYGLTGDRPVLGIFGGSLGAGVLNQVAENLVGAWQGVPIDVVHLTGERNLEHIVTVEPSPNVNWVRRGFEDSMESFYAVCHLVIARAGGAVAELTATSTPSILVPGSFGSSGHQAANAHFLTESGAAVVVEESRLSVVPELVRSLLGDQTRLDQMAKAAGSIAKPRAAHTIAETLMEQVP